MEKKEQKGRTRGKKWTEVSRSKDTWRRKKHEVKGYTMKWSKAYRISAHKRRPRRTDEQIEKANERKRKQEAKKKGKKDTNKTTSQKTLSGSSKGKGKKIFKKLEKQQSKISKGKK